MQHQAYQPVLPCVNKYLQYRWDKNCYEMHRNKVKSAKPTINTTPPKTYNHILVKLKTKQLEEERVSRIKRENHMLLDKMSHIMQTSGGVDCKNDYLKKRPRYSVQVWQEQWLKNLQLMENIGRYPRLYTAQGSSLPPISADRQGNVENKKTGINKHEGSADIRKEKKECDEKPTSEHKVTSSEDEA
ncbi:hypothetical protein H4Q32_008362 [Labeo rohita]|uniref:Uncharacterized protein n=1 Tax=Labeo rohita TaxID=84645 RepID=A0ABQ8MDC2_LABRO|nr:hypothetical protein H4Q32_008362 [Labeo rohita]